jgi:hypothetical protein
MDFAAKKRLIWVAGATVMTALGLTLGSAALSDKADAQGCALDSKAFQKSGGACFVRGA